MECTLKLNEKDMIRIKNSIIVEHKGEIVPMTPVFSCIKISFFVNGFVKDKNGELISKNNEVPLGTHEIGIEINRPPAQLYLWEKNENGH